MTAASVAPLTEAVTVHGPVVLTWTIFLGKSGRRMDIDNLTPCLKPCQDQLVLCKIIDGDTPDVVRQIVIADQVLWATHRGLPYIAVTVTPVADALGGGFGDGME
jgi:hypothetical protein